MSEVRLQMLNLTNALAALTTTLNASGVSRNMRAAPTDYESETELPMKLPLGRKEKRKRLQSRWRLGAWYEVQQDMIKGQARSQSCPICFARGA